MISHGEEVPRLIDCPECGGRGWFLIQPFATGGGNGFGGLGNMRKCDTCVRAHEYYTIHNVLPDDIISKMQGIARKKEIEKVLDAQRATLKKKKKSKRRVR